MVKKAAGRPKSKRYQERIKVDSTPEELAKSVFVGKAKPKSQWSYLKENSKQSG